MSMSVKFLPLPDSSNRPACLMGAENTLWSGLGQADAHKRRQEALNPADPHPGGRGAAAITLLPDLPCTTWANGQSQARGAGASLPPGICLWECAPLLSVHGGRAYIYTCKLARAHRDAAQA